MDYTQHVPGNACFCSLCRSPCMAAWPLVHGVTWSWWTNILPAASMPRVTHWVDVGLGLCWSCWGGWWVPEQTKAKEAVGGMTHSYLPGSILLYVSLTFLHYSLCEGSPKATVFEGLRSSYNDYPVTYWASVPPSWPALLPHEILEEPFLIEWLPPLPCLQLLYVSHASCCPATPLPPWITQLPTQPCWQLKVSPTGPSVTRSACSLSLPSIWLISKLIFKHLVLYSYHTSR